MSNNAFPDYYEILRIDETATEAQIRTAYKKQSLLTHPDRLKNATEAERAEATKKFQTVADAYYVLSDPGRRRAYDAQRSYRGSGPSTSASGAGMGGFPGGFAGFDNSDSASANFFSQFFGRGGAGAAYADEDTQSSFGGSESSTGARPNAEHVFGDVFEDLLTPEVQRVVPFWKYVAGASGAALGFVVGNLPGAGIGALAGSKLGAIRDAKGKSVAAVFADLGGDQKAQILQALLAKVIGSATGR